MFQWRYLDAAGAETGSSEPFEDREAAEAWMGDAWSELLANGIEEVALIDRERERMVYRMGLREA